MKAQFGPCTLYAEGRGVRLDDQQALKWFHRGAHKGSADAQFSLGKFYFGGRGVRKDEEYALKWFVLAAEQGDADAAYEAGKLQARGKGNVRQDREKAYSWLKVAESRQHDNATSDLEDLEPLMTPEQIENATKVLDGELGIRQ